MDTGMLGVEQLYQEKVEQFNAIRECKEVIEDLDQAILDLCPIKVGDVVNNSKGNLMKVRSNWYDAPKGRFGVLGDLLNPTTDYYTHNHHIYGTIEELKQYIPTIYTERDLAEAFKEAGITSFSKEGLDELHYLLRENYRHLLVSPDPVVLSRLFEEFSTAESALEFYNNYYDTIDDMADSLKVKVFEHGIIVGEV